MTCPNAYSVYTLSFTPGITSNTLVGDLLGWTIFGFKMKSYRLTPIQKRQNYWAQFVILDGRYPALVWEHEFQATLIASTPLQFVQQFLNLAGDPPVDANPLPLVLRANTNGVVQDIIAFGNCYMDTSDQGDPKEGFLYSAAGGVNFRFLGTKVPSILINTF